MPQLRTGEQQTLHLVVRDSGDHDSRINTPSRATPVRGPSPAPGSTLPRADAQPQGQPHAHHHHHHHHQHAPHRPNPIRNGTPTLPNPYPMRNPTPGLPNPAVAQMMQLHQLQQLHPQLSQHIQQIQQQHQPWLNVANQLQREATYRQILAQQQRDRAAMGYNGVQDNGNGLQGQGNMDPGVEGLRRRVTPFEGSPLHGAGPTSNPGRVQVTLAPAEVLNVFRGADTTQATQTITNAMHRSASGASLASMASLANPNGPIQPIQPGVTTPLYPGGSRYASRAATPDPSGRPASHVGGFAAFAAQQQLHPQPSHTQPEVYILSSPTGPRGLLVNNPSDMYITPAARPLNLQQQVPYFPAAPRPPYFGLPYPLPSHAPTPQVQPQNQPAAPPQQFPLTGQRQGQPQQEPPQAQVRIQRDFRVPARHGHPNNPGAGALMAAAWPHVWLIIRLVIFVWWFTSGDASWSRWIAMIAIAIVVFLVNTGLIDGFVNQAWNPLRQHLEGLLPLGDANPPPQPGLQPPQPPAPGRDAPIPEPPPLGPAEVAARLVARRRHDNANWLLDLARRLERAGLLFLASIAPGVAERHIAHLEAQERAAERQRREEEEAEARAAAAAAAATEATDENDQTHNEGEGSTESQPRQRQRAGSVEV